MNPCPDCQADLRAETVYYDCCGAEFPCRIDLDPLACDSCGTWWFDGGEDEPLELWSR